MAWRCGSRMKMPARPEACRSPAGAQKVRLWGGVGASCVGGVSQKYFPLSRPLVRIVELRDDLAYFGFICWHWRDELRFDLGFSVVSAGWVC